jgi:hypothetical protein
MRDERGGSHDESGKANKPREIFASVSIDTSSSMEATASARSGATQREVLCDLQYVLIRGWAESSTLEEMVSHPLTEHFHQRLHEVPAVRDELLLCFRGRFIKCGYPHEAENMGPPCREQSAVGRYNREHEPVLYLCDSAAGIQRELRYRNPVGKLYCQKYLIPSGLMRIADLSGGEPDSLESQVLEHAEENGSGSSAPAYPAFSRFIGDLVRDAKYDGMVVRGAQGQPGQYYRNIVIFDPWLNERWVGWLAPATEPYTLDPA